MHNSTAVSLLHKPLLDFSNTIFFARYLTTEISDQASHCKARIVLLITIWKYTQITTLITNYYRPTRETSTHRHHLMSLLSMS